MSQYSLQTTLFLWVAAVVLGCGPSAPPVSGDAGSTDVAAADAGVDDADSTAALYPDFEQLERLVRDLRATDDSEERQALVARFHRTISYSTRGFPLRASVDGVPRVAIVAFLENRTPDASIAVAGGFTGWEPRAMDAPVDGVPLYVYVGRAPVSPSNFAYKLVENPGSDAELWFADPWARRYEYDRFGEFSLMGVRPERGHLERWPAFDEAVDELESRTLRIYVPPGFDEDSGGYPVMIAQDGQNLFDPGAIHGGWRANDAAEAAISEQGISRFLIVGVPNTDARVDEYTHVEDRIDGHAIGGRADAYLSFVVDGVLPFVRERYRASDSANRTAILGSSLGGLVSLYAGWQYPDTFGYVGSMSGTLAWGQFGLDKATVVDFYQGRSPGEQVLYIDSGGAAGIECDGLHPVAGNTNHDNYCSNMLLKTVLDARGWEAEQDYIYRWDEGAPHSETAWAQRFPQLLVDWFPGR